jgi:hypothetical protein
MLAALLFINRGRHRSPEAKVFRTLWLIYTFEEPMQQPGCVREAGRTSLRKIQGTRSGRTHARSEGR